MVARSIRSPGTNAIHRLGATRLGARLVVVGVWAAVSVVGSVLTDLVQSASLIFVEILFVQKQRPSHLGHKQISTTTKGQILPVSRDVKLKTPDVVARRVGSPRPNAIYRLGTPTSRARLVVVGVRAAVSVVSSVGADLVILAPPVLVVLGVMLARAIWVPSTSTVHWLRATRLSALLVVVAEGASVSVVGGVLGVLVGPAPLVLVVLGVMVARAIGTPRSSTVHRLRATRGRALLVVVVV